MPDTGSYVLSVNAAFGAGGVGGAAVAGSGREVEEADALEAAAARRFSDFMEVEGRERVYFVVMRVLGTVSRDKRNVGAERRTEVGLAWRRRADWVSHSWLVGRYGIVGVVCGLKAASVLVVRLGRAGEVVELWACCLWRNVVVWKLPRCGDKLAMYLFGRPSGAVSRNSDYASIQHKC